MTRGGGRWLAALAVALSVGCGGMGAGDDDDASPDAGASSCEMTATVAPSAPLAPATVVVTASIIKLDVSGIESYDWTVDRAGAPVATTDRDPSGGEIEFAAPIAGPYRVTLSGDVGGVACTPYTTTVNVTDPGAHAITYRLALVPRPDQPAPPQLQRVTIPGGADFDLGPRTLDSGLRLDGTLTASGGAPAAGYLRAVATADPALGAPREAFAGAAGSFELRLLAGAYDVLIVPDGDAVAPALLRAVDAPTLAGAVALPAADAITGTVVRADDSPVAGARVALTLDGVPSTVATTDGSGAFTVLGHATGATGVTVVPPDSSLPQLELAVDAGLIAGASPLAVRYAATAARGESVTLVASDGTTPVPGASVTFLARSIAAAGTVTSLAGAPIAAAGRARVSATADAAGSVGPLLLAPAVYDVVVTPPATGAGADMARLAVVDLTAGAPGLTTLALASPAQVGAAAPGAPAGTRVTAVPRGALASGSAPTVDIVTVAADRVELALVGGGSYDVTVHVAATSGRAPARWSLVAPAAGASAELDPIDLPAAIAVTGTVQSPDIAGGVSGVAVRLLCDLCTGDAAAVAIAQTVSGAGGSFTLLVPDPGVTE